MHARESARVTARSRLLYLLLLLEHLWHLLQSVSLLLVSLLLVLLVLESVNTCLPERLK